MRRPATATMACQGSPNNPQAWSLKVPHLLSA
jgi:hypothetical protein